MSLISLGTTVIPGENGNNGYAKFWGGNKMHYGLWENSEFKFSFWKNCCVNVYRPDHRYLSLPIFCTNIHCQ